MVRIGVDIGGTFTDIVVDTGSERHIHKLLTTVDRPEMAVIDGIRTCLGQAGIEPGEVALIVHGTTLVTNAVIERKGVKTGLIATRGFRDTLEIADEGRFDQYDLNIVKPAPVIPRHLRFTVAERISAQGEILLPLDEAEVAALVPVMRAEGIESIAVALMHSYALPEQEVRVAEIIRAAWPAVAISLSSSVCPEIREYERTSTTAINAYVQPLMAGYLERLEAGLQASGLQCPILLMASGGSLATLEIARQFPVRLVESGPAGGAILAADLAKRLGETRVLSFDMGGTTAKICLIQDGEPQSARAFEVDRSARFMKGSGFPLRIPVIEMVEIGAGGGSLASLDLLGRVKVGPESAGADPGPASYGLGGEAPAVTDADLLMGKLDAQGFAGGRMQLDTAAASSAVSAHVAQGLGLDTLQAAAGIVEVVDENMGNAARVHAVESGVDVADFTIIAFGGAAPLHATRVAEKLGLRRIVVPADAGVGSAIGFLSAAVAFEQTRSLYQRLSRLDHGAVNGLLDSMAEEATAIVRQGAPVEPLHIRRIAYMRYVGQGHEIAVRMPEQQLSGSDLGRLRKDFEDAYRRLFERIIPNGEIEILTWSVQVSAPAAEASPIGSADPAPAPRPKARRKLFLGDRGQVEVPVYARLDFRPGSSIDGPALIDEMTTTTVVGAAFAARIDAARNLILEQKGELA